MTDARKGEGAGIAGCGRRHLPGAALLAAFALLLAVGMPYRAHATETADEDGGIAIAVASGEADAAALASASVERIAGDDRYGTAAEVASRFEETGGTVVLATGANYPDALCASALAGCFGSPVLITRPGSLPQPTAEQLARLAPSKVLIVGGESAVGTDVERAVRESYCADVERIAGDDRYGTCAAVAARVASASAAAGRASDTCVIATGANFADALSASPYAYATCSPVLLCDGGALPAALAAAARGYGAAVVAGGTSAVPDSVLSQLPGASVTRLAGADRYETSAKVAQWASENGLSGTAPAVATGADFPDALCGGAICGAAASPLLLVDGADSPGIGYLEFAPARVSSCLVLGGTAAVGGEVQAELEGGIYPTSVPEYTAEALLAHLYICGYNPGNKGGYDCEDAADRAELARTLVQKLVKFGWDSEEGPGPYPGMGWTDFLQGGAPARLTTYDGYYLRTDAYTADWVARHVYNLTESEIQGMKADLLSGTGAEARWYGGVIRCYEDGWYYAPTGGMGWFTPAVSVLSSSRDGSRCTMRCKFYPADERQKYAVETCYATVVADVVDVDGKAYWSLRSITWD